MKERLSDELRNFVAAHIDSVELMEVLVLLHEHEGRRWTGAEVNDSIRSSEPAVYHRLETLMRLGLVSKTGEPPVFSYAPQNEELRAIAKNLVIAYSTHRVEIIQIIYTKPLTEIVNFADAFRLRGGKKENG